MGSPYSKAVHTRKLILCVHTAQLVNYVHEYCMQCGYLDVNCKIYVYVGFLVVYHLEVFHRTNQLRVQLTQCIRSMGIRPGSTELKFSCA